MNLMSLQDSCTGMSYNSIHISVPVATDKDTVTIKVYFPDHALKDFKILDSADRPIENGIGTTDGNGCGSVDLKFVSGTYTLHARICDTWDVNNSCSLNANIDTGQTSLVIIPSPVSEWVLLGAAGVVLWLYYIFSRGTLVAQRISK